MKLQRPANFFLSLLAMAGFLLISCAKKTSQPAAVPIEKSFPPPKVTVLADLPDSLQPKVTYLKDVPPPEQSLFTIPDPKISFIDSITGLPIPPEAQGRGQFIFYTSDQGLALDCVSSMTRDSRGHIWCGLNGAGVSRFDGTTFQTFSPLQGLPHNSVWRIMEDRKGNLWFATFGGISKYDGKTLTNFTTNNGLPYNDVSDLCEDENGHIWGATIGGGIFKYDGQSFVSYDLSHGLPDLKFLSIKKDSKGKIWFGSRNGSVIQFDIKADGGKGKFIDFTKMLHLQPTNVRAIEEDQHGNIWFGQSRNGVTCYDGKSLKHFDIMDGLPSNDVWDIFKDSNGIIWVATTQGLARFTGNTFVKFTSSHGLTNEWVLTVTEDMEGNIWGGTYSGGIFRYEGPAFVHYVSAPLDNHVSSILEDSENNLWLCSSQYGVVRFDGLEAISFGIEPGLENAQFSWITEQSPGRFWLSSSQGTGIKLLELPSSINKSVAAVPELSHPLNKAKPFPTQKGTITTYLAAQGLPNESAFLMHKDTEDKMWFPTYGGGISRFDGESFTTYTTAQGIAGNDAFGVFQDSDGLFWFMFLGPMGLTVFDGKSFQTFTTEHGLPDNNVWHIDEDLRGNLWIATENGLVLIRKERRNALKHNGKDSLSIQDSIFEVFTTLDGLPSSYFSFVMADDTGDIWLCSNDGLARLHGGPEAFASGGKIEIFNREHGYPFKEVTSVCQHSSGILWLATGSDYTGLIRFDPSALRRNTIPPAVELIEIRIENQQLSWHGLQNQDLEKNEDDSLNASSNLMEEADVFDRQLRESEHDSLRRLFGDIKFDSITPYYHIPAGMILPYRHNSVTFDVNTVVMTRNQMVRYQYMLEGYDKSWSPPTATPSVTFGNINEGHYTFKVKAVNPDGLWGEPLLYTFSVLPPMHRTWWAYTFYTLSLMAMMYFVHRYQRSRTIRKEEEKANQKQAILNERLRISRDLHDEVGSTLSGIAMYSHIAKEQIKTESREVVFNSLNVMQESAGEMVNKLNDIVWLLNPEKAQLHQLIEKLEVYAERMAEIKNIQVTTTISERISAIELPIEVRRNIYLIFKEAINNAVKHSQATSLHIQVQDDDHTLDFILEDNGTGFDADQVKKGNGLDNMHNRANEIGAQLSLASSSGNGTRLSLVYKRPS